MEEQNSTTESYTAPEEAKEESKEEEPLKEVPAELQGLPDNIVKETIKKASEEEGVNAEADSDNKSIDANEDDEDNLLPNAQIPYKRFKAKVDRVNELEAELKKYKSMPQDTQGVTQLQPKTPEPAPQQTTFPPLDEKTVAILNTAIKNVAMERSGMTQDDVDALDYLEDDDPRVKTWKMAVEMSKPFVINRFQKALDERVRQRNDFANTAKTASEEYNAFYETEAKDKDFQKIVDYANNDYFRTLSPNMQKIIANAYTHIEMKRAIPEQVALIQNYYASAKRSFKERGRAPSSQTNTRIQQANALPRAGQVNGTSGEVGAVSEETLTKMLRDMPWEKIPKEYQDMLLSGRIG